MDWEEGEEVIDGEELLNTYLFIPTISPPTIAASTITKKKPIKDLNEISLEMNLNY